MTTSAAIRNERKDFVLTDKDFGKICRLVGERTGIVLSEAKRDMVYGRLSRRLRSLGLRQFSDYLALLEGGDETELVEFTNAITTNLTAFFREPHHFDFLTNTLLPDLIRRKTDRRLRVWSAGCSSGEEPYTIAMCLRETVPPDWDVRILATDLDSNMVARGQAGIYTAERVEGLSKERLKRWVKRGRGAQADNVRMAAELREMIVFKQLNLMHNWPMKGPFDFIFCRNVVIYFNKDTQRELFSRFAAMLEPGSHLFIGHSESLYRVSDDFELLGQTIYRRK